MKSELRKEYIKILKMEVEGPEPSRLKELNQSNGEEILRRETPLSRYGAGILYPRVDSLESFTNTLSDGINDDSAETSDSQGFIDTNEDLQNVSPYAQPKRITDEEDNDSNDDLIKMINAYKPSAMGLSCILPKNAGVLTVEINCASYLKKHFDCHYCSKIEDPSKANCRYCGSSKKKTKEAYFRLPLKYSFEINAEELLNKKEFKKTLKPSDSSENYKSEIGFPKDSKGLDLYLLVSDSNNTSENEYLLRISLINNNSAEIDHEKGYADIKSEDCFFQCGFNIKIDQSSDGFSPIETQNALHSERDIAINNLLYRNRPVFAIGNGCSADWESMGNKSFSIRTECVPTYEMHKIDAQQKERFKDVSFNFLNLSDKGSKKETLKNLKKLPQIYDAWLSKKDIESDDLPEKLKTAAKNNILQCRKALSRIREGISILEKDETAMRSFRLMNRAILLQHLKTKQKTLDWKLVKGEIYDEPEIKDEYVEIDLSDKTTWPDLGYDPGWYPYQLAFILINLKSITDKTSDERENVECLWFPTGGGKTEAYLGLIGFSIFHRKLKNPHSQGVISVMRYTLRLLTAQQFQRASSLIVACDFIRNENQNELGAIPISIGMWVGPMTPNTRKDAKKNVSELIQQHGKAENRMIMTKCPWCSCSMGVVSMLNSENNIEKQVFGYQVDQKSVRFVCENSKCHYSSLKRPIPVYVVDEDIYEIKPSLLVGTVDKFARLAWDNSNQDSINLFRHIKKDHQDAPDLIIQDELHLISGPLGSVVGMYETTIQNIFSSRYENQTIYPKIIASTATVTRAPEQMNQLYNKKYDSEKFISEMVNLFPHPVLDYDDSFFGKEDIDPEKSRVYVGLNPSGYSDPKTAQVRIISSLLQGTKSLNVDEEKDRDPYWTLMAYFNSIRELSGVSTLVHQDIKSGYMPQLQNRLYPDVFEKIGKLDKEKSSKAWLESPIRNIFQIKDLELTSRQTNDISEALKRLETSYPSENRDIVDICLATNMISVGVDISRLGSMLVVGQPKTTSEYIQATSRVGRKYPGVVFVWYNNSRPRDKSHYEQFRAYHQKIYSKVEPTSITPFSNQVRERALHSQIFILAKYFGSRNAIDFPDNQTRKIIKQIILDKVAATDKSEYEDTAQKIEDIFNRWEDFSELTDWGNMGGTVPSAQEYYLMFPFGKEPPSYMKDQTFRTLTSMRNVDAECKGQIIERYDEL
tara:strand:- start:6360 stop:9983 length:3624 start_codon:yes stop_codon:yes gene_type:complete